MDSGEGRFEMFHALADAEEAQARNPKAREIFTVGDHVRIRSSYFRIHKVTPFGMLLKLLKDLPPNKKGQVYRED